ncbi:MAG TPA: exodeoxyribonuclease VII large subunit, partial [Kofleriaceae bacterium]|nr:exodeoxyribonuclease VII large subunit [Kofleriaceae bacterium]
MAVPVLADMARRLAGEERRLRRELDHRLRVERQEIDQLEARARHTVHAALGERRRRLADRQHRLETLHPRRRVMADRARLADLQRRLDALHPRTRLVADRARLTDLAERATAVMRRRLHDGARRFGALGGRLDALSPLRVLERGYALARSGDAVITSSDQVAPGDALSVRLRRGQLGCRVERVEPEPEPETE